jgi:hypothetical protein
MASEDTTRRRQLDRALRNATAKVRSLEDQRARLVLAELNGDREVAPQLAKVEAQLADARLHYQRAAVAAGMAESRPERGGP